MKRGELWSISQRGSTGKPRPSLIVRADAFAHAALLTCCALTSQDSTSSLLRPLIMPTGVNGLRWPSWVMVDRIESVERTRVGAVIGVLEPEGLADVENALRLYLGLGPPA